MIECKFRLIPEYPFLDSYKNRLKEGRYHNSKFSDVEGGRYVVGAYIEFDHDKYKKLEEIDIIDQCVESLNVLITPRKKKGKKQIKPFYKYGLLKDFKSKIAKDEKGKVFIIALLTTDDPKNKHFWNYGEEKTQGGAMTSKRGRPRKKR